jgi:hypothetical protein
MEEIRRNEMKSSFVLTLLVDGGGTTLFFVAGLGLNFSLAFWIQGRLGMAWLVR